MNIAVRYYTRSGNTKKLAEAIGEALGVEVLPVEIPLTSPVDLLFLGCSYYAFDVDEHVKSFIIDNALKIRKIALFGTSAMMKSIYKPVKKVADGCGVSLLAKDFHCRGQFGPAHKGRPNEADCAAAANFAKALTNSQ